MTKPLQGFSRPLRLFFQKSSKLGIQPMCYVYMGKVRNDNIPMLIVVMALTIPIAMLAIRLAERAMKKSAEALK